jgi:calpain-15
MKLRNPWGHKEWLGNWSDRSSKWTPELRKQLNVKDEEDGTFYIGFDDYINYYRSTTICKVHDGYKIAYL